MNEPLHPSENISAELATILRSTARGAELLGRLHPEQLFVIYQQNWFNLFVPQSLGGLQLTLPQALQTQEAIAWADGSTAWVVTLCSGANFFAGYLPPPTAEAFFENPKVCLAGSGRPSGTARITPGGFTISGFWHYATGAPHATAFTANCFVEDEAGQPVNNADGSPLMYAFIFKRDEVIVHTDWHTTGMIATASNSFQVNNLFVPESRRFTIAAAKAVLPHPVYQYPFLQFAQATLCVNMAGMAQCFIGLCQTIFAERNNSVWATAAQAAHQKLQQAVQQVQQARAAFYHAVHLSWVVCEGNRVVDDNLLLSVSSTSHHLTQTSLQAVDTLYPFCGLAAADTRTEINRVWRNLHTASQHTLLLPVA